MGDFKDDLFNERRDIKLVKDWLEVKHLVEGTEEASDQEQQEHHFDFYGYLYGERTTFEAKIRSKIYEDLLIETLSCIEKKTLGWIYLSEAKHLIYSIIENKKIQRLSMYALPKLREWWVTVGSYKIYKKFYGKTGTLYSTENYAVTLRDIPRDILEFEWKDF